MPSIPDDLFADWDPPTPEQAKAQFDLEFAADALSKGIDPMEVDDRKRAHDEICAATEKVSAAAEEFCDSACAGIAGVPLQDTAACREKLERAYGELIAAVDRAAQRWWC
jgi:hypothetical protein